MVPIETRDVQWFSNIKTEGKKGDFKDLIWPLQLFVCFFIFCPTTA